MRARKYAPLRNVSGAVHLNAATERGSTNVDTDSGSRSARAPSMSDGSVAIDERETNPTSHAGAAARANSRTGTRPPSTATGNAPSATIVQSTHATAR